MATLLLQAAGAAIGGWLGATGAAIGTAAGAIGGYLIDQALVGGTRRIQGPRLTGPRPLSAEEGQPIPRLYGTARLGATVIWATRFEEEGRTERQGGKGGPKVTTYSYYANVALALCEGEIAALRRIWADGAEIDREQIELRLYRGTPDQPPDPLIEAKQGEGNAPAYRGVAYVVLERFPLEAYGNRIPQFQFEVIRPVGQLHRDIRAVALIPGASEYGLSPTAVTRSAPAFWQLARPVAGTLETLNRAVSFAGSDLAASLDELQAICPNLEHVALVTSWFGDDLRAGHCRLRPAIVDRAAPEASRSWRVSGISRSDAVEVTRHLGSPAYGGTPSDLSVIEAIVELKARGLKVTLYPFLMMDIAAGNAIGQPAYPWRGRICCDPGPGVSGSADRTALARDQVAAFCGTAEPGDFTAGGDTIRFAGAPGDWGYRRMILHHAHLALAAGGVDAFLIGSELRGLTTLRDETDAYPFVEELMQLAQEVKTILGDATLVTYAADWSEYFGHQPSDGSGDMRYHLDPLWACDAVDAIGIDNYFPLSDWRDGDEAGASPDGATSPHDRAALRAAIAGGEGFDWYYASDADRAGRIRTPITDEAYGKHWVFRCKDLRGWWENAHHERIGGVEMEMPTGWVPRSKPIWFTELGCAAIDKGPNQPNLFGDLKSSEHGRPWHSDGSRDDFVQRAFLEAHQQAWNPAHPGFSPASNPVSPAYGGHMVDPARIYHWCWDARPYPAFPLAQERWKDGGNWPCGHWLNGRLCGVALGDLLQAILADHGLPTADTSRVGGMITGYVIDRPEAARNAIDALCDLFGIAASEAGGVLNFFNEDTPDAILAEPEETAVEDEGTRLAVLREPLQDVPGEVVLHLRDPLQEYQTVTVRHGQTVTPSAGQAEISLPLICETGRGEALAANWLRRRHAARDRISFALPLSARQFQPGSVFRFPFAGASAPFMVTRIEEGMVRRIEARRLSLQSPMRERPRLPGNLQPADRMAGPPLALVLDLPAIGTGEPMDQFRVAAWCRPWRTQVVSSSPEASGFVERAVLNRPARIGMLGADLAPGPVGRKDHANSLILQLFEGELASISTLQWLDGGNLLAVQCDDSGWEILQFQEAEEIASSLWRLAGLLRGQAGTEDAMAAGASSGNLAVLLDSAVISAGLSASEAGLERRWRVQPAGQITLAETTAEFVAAGGVRALRPLAPVHLKAVAISDGGLRLEWIRRGRLAADSWLVPEIPLSEESEIYVLRILDPNGSVLREGTVDQPQWTYPAEWYGADRVFGQQLRMEVRQISATVGEGIAARLPLA